MGGRATTFILTVFADDQLIRRGKATKSRCQARNVTLMASYSTRPATELHRHVAPRVAGCLPVEAMSGLDASLHPAALAHDSSSLAFAFPASSFVSPAATQHPRVAQLATVAIDGTSPCRVPQTPPQELHCVSTITPHPRLLTGSAW